MTFNKVKYIFLILIISIILSILWLSQANADKSWQIIQPGIEYLHISSIKKPWSQIHVYRVNTTKYNLKIASSKKNQQNIYTLSKKYSKFLIATNGGFFDDKYRPIGLRISDYKILNAYKPISWWGILVQRNNTLSIASSKNYRYDKDIKFAIQCGPRLIVANKILNLKPGIAERTALGIDKHNRLIILVTEHHPISTQKLANILKSNPINCSDALNLDGGHSTQMIANLPTQKLTVLGLSPISDSILIIKI